MSTITPELIAYMQAVCRVLEREGHEKHLAVPEAEAVIDGHAKQQDERTVALAIIISRGMRKAAAPGLLALIEYQNRTNNCRHGRPTCGICAPGGARLIETN